jgi:hypothetical protein
MIVSNIGITPDLSAIYTPNSAMDTAFVHVSLIPRRMMRACGVNAIVIGLHAVFPVFPLVNLGGAEPESLLRSSAFLLNLIYQ